MPNGWPFLIDASRMTFQVAKARTDFLLTVESQGNPSVNIRFPLSYGPELAEQVLNMLETAMIPFDPKRGGNPNAN